MVRETDISDFFYTEIPLIDVRSPGEYLKGHIPGAVNIPLFSDAERAQVGTLYTQVSAEKAMEVGYSCVIPKLADFITQSRNLAPDGKVAVHCWRGGMRSRAFADHLSQNGFKTVLVISGGYKAFRNYVMDFFNKPFHLNIIGGFTGSGKTGILRHLGNNNHQIIDLEKLACHKGSSFGGLGQEVQPTTEQFENNLFRAFLDLDPARPVWIEDESHNIGGVNIPLPLYNRMNRSKLFFLEIPAEIRAGHIVEEYAGYDPHLIGEAINRISKRLGGENARKAHEYLAHRDYFHLVLLILKYYDKVYLRGLSLHNPGTVTPVTSGTTDPSTNAEKIVAIYEK